MLQFCSLSRFALLVLHSLRDDAVSGHQEEAQHLNLIWLQWGLKLSIARLFG
jgi:hypothetical protein